MGWEERVESPFSPLRLSPSPPPPPPPLFEPALQATVVQYSKGGNCYPTNKLKKAYRFKDEDDYDDEI